MPTTNELLEHVINVLKRLPDVEVRHTRANDRFCAILLSLDQWPSLLTLEYCAAGANVPLHSWARFPPGSAEALANPARALDHEYRIEAKSVEDLGERLRVLGAHLVWALYGARRFTVEEANQLLDVFNAVHVPRGAMR